MSSAINKHLNVVLLGTAGSAAVVLALKYLQRRDEMLKELENYTPSATDVGGSGPEADYGLGAAQRAEMQCINAQVTEAGLDGDAFQAAVKALESDGVVCLKSLFSETQLSEFRKVYDDCWQKTRCEMSRPGRAWIRRIFTRMGGSHGSRTAALDKGLYHRVPIVQLPSKPTGAHGQFGDINYVTRMGKGRYDFSYGMDGTLLSSDVAIRSVPVRQLLKHLLGPDSEWAAYPGGLPAEGTCGPGRWHRDTYSLWEDEGTQDKDVSPFYFTMIVPLTKIEQKDGPTQFRVGSHHMTASQVGSAPFCSQNLEPGDAVLFDGRTVHRGGPRAEQAGARHALYFVYHKWWYQDNEIGIADVCRVESLRKEEISKMESEEPWLKQRSHLCIEEAMYSGWCSWKSGKAHTLFLGLAVGSLLGYFAKS